jgi:hypothetical protein
LPEQRQEFIKIEGGLITGGEVVFEDSSLFSELPKISLTPVTNQTVSVGILERSTTGFKYKVMIKTGWFRWRNRTGSIPVIWIAIQEK